MPCSYNCQATIQWAREIRNAIRKEEPEFVRLTDRYLKMPFLIFYEKKCYAFDGQIKDGKLRYNDIFFTGGRNEDNIYEKIIRKGDCLFIEENTVIILKKQRKIAVIKCQKRNFASENPFIIQFN